MQFLIIGYDGVDEQALARRMAVREAHLALGDKMRDAGKMLYGAAILNDSGKMIGRLSFANSLPVRSWTSGRRAVYDRRCLAKG